MSLVQSIVSRYGGWLASDKNSGAIPAPGHSARDRSISLRLNADRKLLIHCFSDTDWRDIKALLIRDGVAASEDFVSSGSKGSLRAARRERARRANAVSPSLHHGKAAWAKRSDILGSLGAVYLKSRGLASLLSSPALGYLDSWPLSPNKSNPRAPCLLAKISNPAGRFVGVQATFLFRSAGGLTKRRLIYGRQKGFAIRLGRPSETLLVGEGLESTASAAQRFGAPGWALLNTANLASFTTPSGVRSLIIACDNDGPGWKAALHCLGRNEARGVACEIWTPERERTDWNDLDRMPGSP